MECQAIMNNLNNENQHRHSCYPMALFRLMHWALLISALVLGGSAHANAYSVEVAVADRSVDEQNAAYQVAFRRVLLNNSGDKTLLNRDGIREALNDAENYVTAFAYRTPAPGTVISSETPITQRVSKSGEATQLMRVTFDRTLVRQLIDSTAGVTDQTERPIAVASQGKSALVWLLIQDGNRDIRISDSQALNVQARAREIAGAMGISLVFPAGDATDRSVLTVDDLLAMDSQAVELASQRYEQGTILYGSLRRSGIEGWYGHWVKLSDGEKTESEFNSGSLDESLQQGLSVLVDAGAVDTSYRYGGPATSEAEGLVWLGSVDSLADYASVMRFFEEIPAVGTVYPKEIGQTTMVIAVVPRAALRDIENAAAGQNWIKRTLPSLGDGNSGLAASADLALELNL